jgi:DNA-binding response OmpR family regulator
MDTTGQLDTKKKHVLVVEDDTSVALILKESLTDPNANLDV